MSEQVTSSEKNNNITSFTPKTLINANKLFFSIPLYQRIFTWGDKEIEQLLYDLEQTFSNSKGQNPYYLGMLTLKRNDETNSYDVIDGQQRLTILMLLGAVLSKEDGEWKEFLSVRGRTRLNLPSREQDNRFLEEVINNYEGVLPRTTDNEGEKNQNSEDCKQKNQQLLDYNPNLLIALESITSYLVKYQGAEKEKFSKFVFEQLHFFATYLPDYYTPGNLNKYFDRMNDSGKNLEPHEILLGEYLKVLKIEKNEREEKIAITELWKKATDLSNPMISADEIRKPENEKAFIDCLKGTLIFNNQETDECQNVFVNFSNYLKNGAHEKEQARQIGNEESGSNPKGTNPLTIKALADKVMSGKAKNFKDLGDITYGYSQSLLTINELLLLCLYKTLEKLENNKDIKTSSFFNTSKIISTFQEYLPWTDENNNTKNILLFMKTFFCSRLLLDLFFLRRDQSGRYMPPLFFAPEKENEQEENEQIVDELATLMRYEEFLYAVENSGSNYCWFMPLLNIFEKCVTNHLDNDLNNYLTTEIFGVIKNHDADAKSKNDLEEKKLSYGTIQRYWFWRLDLALWCKREEKFKKNEFLKVANNYHFSRNRSIEHVAPQHPKSNSEIKIEDPNVRNSFGNLCMISAGLNSSLKNESFDVKKAHVESYLYGSVGGTIESLKLLAIYYYCESKTNKTWNVSAIKEHGKEMMELLKNELKKELEESESTK